MRRVAALLKFQAGWVADESPLKMCVKSRQVGLTWANAVEDVKVASRSKKRGGMDCWYLCQSKEETRTYIADCAMWAQAYGQIATQFEEEIIDPEDHVAIQVHAIKFASGHSIRALVGHPRNLRGKRGKVTFDEAAYNDNADEFMAAALPFIRWGGRVAIISSEWHTETAFHKWREAIEAGKHPRWSLRVIDFDDAINDGLYERLVLVGAQPGPYTKELEREWRKREIDDLGADADRELFCIPIGAHDVYLDRATIESCMVAGRPVLRFQPPKKNEDGLPFVDWPRSEREALIDGWLDANVGPCLDALDQDRTHALGADFGRSGDITCFHPVVTLPDLRRSVPFVIELRNTPYDCQLRAYRYVIDRLPKRGTVALDAGLQGAHLAETVRQRYGSQVALINIGNTKARPPDKRPEGSLMYAEMLPPLKSALQKRELELPADDDHARDLMGLRMVEGMPRVPSVRSKGKDGGQRHCDFAVSLALGLWASMRGSGDLGNYESEEEKPRRPRQWHDVAPTDEEEDDDDGDDGDPWRF